ncbi:MAG: hypothetical protein HY391_03340 [Deltaproteobacteria bacterium]|nr:hypothetical protein [Deltaproteobacteria bacterium]
MGRATLRYHQKVKLIHSRNATVAVAELKIFEVPRNSDYPEGLKYSLFLVLQGNGEGLVGFDNHKPKGPHLHLRRKEKTYQFRGTDALIEDFWDLVRKEGF